MWRLLIVATMCTCALSCVRKGRRPQLSGAAWLRMFAHYERVVSDTRVDGVDNRATVGVAARGLLGRRLGWCAGFDASFGGSEGAFVYDANLYLVGGGIRLGKAAQLAVCGGAGLSGAAGALPHAWQLPVEASLAFDLGRRVRPAMWARGVWLLSSNARDGGSTSFDFVDEWSASIGVRVGRHRGYSLRTGNGYFAGVTLAELAGARFVGLTFGHGINAGN